MSDSNDVHAASLAAIVDAVSDRIIERLKETKPDYVCEQHAHPDALIYLDPPYLHSTRVMRGRTYGPYEMTEDDHSDLLDCITSLDAYVIISGYVDDSGLYDTRLRGWKSFQKRSRISAGRGTQIRLETIWCNPQVMDSYAQGVLAFSDEGCA